MKASVKSPAAARPRLIYWIHIALLVPTLLVFLYLLINLLLHPTFPAAESTLDQAIRLLVGLGIAPLTVVVGLLCVRRSPGNVVGAMLALWGCTILAVIKPDETPLIAGFSTLISGMIWPAIYFLFCYFPDGRIYPRRFEKWLDGLLIVTDLSGVISGLVVANTTATTANPLYVPALAPLNDLLTTINSIGCLTAVLFGMVSLVLRFRTADMRTRQQIKWLLFGFLPFALLVIPYLIIEPIPALRTLTDLIGYFMQIWLMIFPVFAIGNAILRHRLYDIDIIIRRTLIYSILTGILAILFFGGVTVVQSAFHAATGQTSDLAIVSSTLAIAALFTPLRRRVQDAIDRRFYRRKYDAEKTLAGFSQTLREETNLAALQESMIGVVRETMQPTRIGLWLRQAQMDTPLERSTD